MKLTLFQVGKKSVPSQNIQHLPYSLHITLARIIGIDEDVIQGNNDKNVKFPGQDLIDITLEASQSIR